jgi:hypothetical protein
VLISTGWRGFLLTGCVVLLSGCAESVSVAAEADEIDTALNRAQSEAQDVNSSMNTAGRP